MNTRTYNGLSALSGNPIRITVEGEKIAAVEPRAEAEGPSYLAPGFFDIQINGYGGVDYSGSDLSPDMVGILCRTLASRGTTRHLPTIITSSYERIVKNLGILTAARRTDRVVRETVPGYHIEGPFISPEDGPRGAHDRAFVRKPDYEEFLRWQEAAEGLIKIVTLAPEAEGALRFIEEISAAGVVASIGHTGADPGLIREAVAAGAKLSTHLGNGSHAMIPRLNNYLWEQLASDELAASIICDGFHLPPSAIKVFVRAKGMDRIILISDVAFLAGQKPGVYHWGSLEVELTRDGRILQTRAPYFAGAGHLLDRGIAQFMKHSGLGLPEAVRGCAINPARLLGFPEEGQYSLTVGSFASFVLFDYHEQADTLRIRRTIIGNEEFVPQ